MRLTLIHTAIVHETTFDALRDQIAPGAILEHVTRPEWLDQARRGGVGPALNARIYQAVRDAKGPVICTCTTLGPAAERAGAKRIDRPMMETAARIGGTAVMAYALDSTLVPSGDLFTSVASGQAKLRLLDLTAHWGLFESGNSDGFHAALAKAIRADLESAGADSVILAQASMAGAAAYLDDLGIPVLASPELALRDGLGL